MKPLSIKIFLPDGDPNGIRVAGISMSTIQAIAFRRNQLGEVRKRFPEISRIGVYILLGLDKEIAGRRIAYIGEGTVNERLNNHSYDDTKNFWTETIALTSKDEELTKSHAVYVEDQLIARSVKNPQWNLTNHDKLQRANKDRKLPLPDRAAMEQFIDQTTILVDALGCDLFRATRDLSSEKMEDIPSDATILPEPIFSYEGKKFKAKMTVNASGDFVVRDGSQARLQPMKSMPSAAKSRRETLKKNGILKETDGALIFTDNCIFESPSLPADVISGTSVNGRTSWKLEDGTTYDAWEKQKNESTSIDETGDASEPDSA